VKLSTINNDNEESARDITARLPHLRRVLVISHVGDNRYKNGGTVYTRSLLELIKIGHPSVDVDLVFFTRQMPALVRRLRQVKSLVRAAFSALPSKALYFRSRSFAKKLVSQLSAEKFDLVIFDHAEMLWCLELVPPDTAVLAVAHNIESRIYEQFLRHRPISRVLFHRDLLKYQRFETERLARVRNVVAISADDAESLRSAIPGLEILVVPPTFSYAPAKRACKLHKPLRVGMLGNFEWWPNRESYDWFLDQVWRHAEVDRELHVYGAHSETLRAGKHTTLHGFVDELSEVWNHVDLMVNPIISGSGVNVKVAEAIYNGMPMLCTPMAVAGLLTNSDPAIAVLESAEEWVSVLRGGEAIALAQRKPLTTTRMHVHASTQATSFATFLDRLITQVRAPGNVNLR
jgi:hypothetical protein